MKRFIYPLLILLCSLTAKAQIPSPAYRLLGVDSSLNNVITSFYLSQVGISGYYENIKHIPSISINGTSHSVIDGQTWTIPTGTGTVTSFSKSDGYGITSIVTNPTTTPVYSPKIDTNTSTGLLPKPNLFPLSDTRYSKLPTMNVGVTRPINGTTFTVSSNKIATVYYNISISCTATIGSAASGTVTLQYSLNGGTTWTTLAEVTNSNTVTLAIALNSVNTQTVVLSSPIPLGALVRMNSTIVGTTTINYIRGVEIF